MDDDDWLSPSLPKTKSVADVLKDGSRSREYMNESFKVRAERGWQAEEKVAEYLRNHGLEVRHPEKKIRENIEDRKDYTDEGDVFYKKDGVWYCIEVKSHAEWIKPFTCKADWPFEHVLLERKHRMKKSFQRTYKWVTVSSDFQYATVTPLESCIYWFEKTIFKKNYGTYETDWYVPLEHVKIIKLA